MSFEKSFDILFGQDLGNMIGDSINVRKQNLASRRRGKKGGLSFWMENEAKSSVNLGNRIAINLEGISEDGFLFV
jgi:hypothetical protein